MRHTKLIYCSILLLTTLLMTYLLPQLVTKLTYTPDRYPFVYYSTILDQLAIIDYSNKEFPMTDKQGNNYTTAQMDSLLPTLNYQQLMSDGRLPDSIKGQEINMRILRANSFTFRYSPSETSTPLPGLYVLFESMPKRVGLTMPEDVFRFDDDIEFINAEKNEVDKTKSKLFQEKLDEEKYVFPSQWAVGNPNPRKPYDEGYFTLDSKGQLFHMKMVNGRPYVKNTQIGDKIDVAYFSMLEVSNKRFYGFLFSKQGEMYIIQNEGGNYQTMKLDIPAIDITTDQVFILGNIFDWTVSITKPNERFTYGLDNNSLKQLDSYAIDRKLGKWDKVMKWLFPVYLTVETKSSNYLMPQIHCVGLYAFALNLILALGYAFIFRREGNVRFCKGIYVLITGVAGFVALLLLPKSKTNK